MFHIIINNYCNLLPIITTFFFLLSEYFLLLPQKDVVLFRYNDMYNFEMYV